ncbi:MFS transporter [Lichenicoccus roseus]|uniref:MFS transporter n=1 Tax=Lichenicoccus roseus TaxID=2683649 RepID=UPI001486CA4D|nr:MFS transporter [Lichenicoccus roseus]
MPPGQVLAAVVGNTLEVFDFIAYGTFAVMIGRAFFPAHDPGLSLLLSVSTFGVGFVTRPLGALLIGALADRRGNRAGMLASLALMGAGSLIIGLLPGYDTLGKAAPILLVAARLIQGIAWGGEAGPATVFLLDAAGAGRQGRLVAWQGVSQAAAVLLCGLLGVLLDLLLGPGALSDWGWRVPFLLGTAVVPVGLWLRSGLHAPKQTASPEAGSALHPSLSRVLFCGFVMMAGGTVSQYFLNFSTSYALTALHLPIRNALSVAVVIGICAAVAAWGGGVLSDRIGSRRVVIWPRLALALLAVPGLWLVSSGGSTAMFIALCAVIAVLQGAAFVASIVLMVQHLPQALRATRFGMIYAVAIAAFGGTAQIAFVWLIHSTGSVIAPGWYLLLVNLLAAAAAMALPEARTAAGAGRRAIAAS